MATLAILSLSRGAAMCRTFAPRVTAASTSLVQRKTLMITPAANKRYLGPEEEHEKVDDLHHWRNERIVAASLIPIIPCALAFPNVYLDMALCTAMVLHSHWRLSGVVQDYIHGEVIPTIGKYAVLLLTIAAFGSLCYFNYNDIGFGRAARLIYNQL